MISLLPQTSSAPSPVVDRYGRRLRYLRVSVTDVCNLSCQYCNPVKGCASTHPHKLSWEDLDFLVDVAVNELGVEAIRVTGGEPTVRPGLVDWIAGIRRHSGLRDVAMTTNGMRLAAMAEDLHRAGLTRVNVSLDSFDAEVFKSVTRGGSLDRVLEGIAAAKQLFGRVKLNAVLLRDVNVPNELEAFVRFSDEQRIEVRFIELMPIFEQKDFFHQHFIAVETVMAMFAERGIVLEPEGDGAAVGNRTGYGPATTYRAAGNNARIGFISQMSNTKCLSCNKLRITSDGALKPCLLSPQEEDLAPVIHRRDRATLAAAMARQFLERAERYDMLEALNDPFKRGMQAIGG